MSQSKAFFLVEKEQSGLRLDQCASRVFEGLSRTRARALISEGSLWVNGKPVRRNSRKVFAGDRITLLVKDGTLEKSDANSTSEASQPVIDWDAHGGRPAFLYRDNWLAVLNKSSGIPTEPTRREDLRICLRQVEATLREEGLHPRRLYVAAVHRLDAQASGALAFALRKKAAAELSGQFASRTAGRIYQALVVGQVESEEGELRHHLARVGPGLRQGVVSEGRGKHAITRYRVLRRFDDASLVELRLQTGRTHQIRVQMSEIGHPLLGDWLYLPEEDASRCPRASRLMLHAVSLSLNHPKTGERMTFEAPLPDDFAGYLGELEGASED